MVDFTETDLPLKKVALFSSGVGFFERQGEASGSVAILLPFLADDVSDALKSLTIMDPASTMPSVTYPAEDTLLATLGSLKPDLSGNPGVADLLNAVRGARIEVTCASGSLTGRILGVEQRHHGRILVPTSHKNPAKRDEWADSSSSWLSLIESGTTQLIDVSTILSYRLLDQDISADMERALDVLFGAATNKIRDLEVRLPADGTREVRLSYVTSAPVWKAAYRLDLTEQPAFLQGWAIIDNSSDVDWEDVELSMSVGRPSSFIQRLYEPYYVEREEIPLAIAGSAEARVYEDVLYEGSSDAVEAMVAPTGQSLAMVAPRGSARARGWTPRQETIGKPVGEQFAFTFPQPVTLNRHRSAMLPLTQGDLEARKLSIFSGHSIVHGSETNPALGVEIVNTTGMPLPAGPVTVFDDELYAGDALMDFLPAGAKRFLSYGDDMAVRGSYTSTYSNHVVSASLAHGVLEITVSNSEHTRYEFVNESPKPRLLIVEHDRHEDEELVRPAKAAEITPTQYRFEVVLPPNSTTEFIVEVKSIDYQKAAIVNDPRNVLMTYSPWGLPKRARAVLERAAEISERKSKAQDKLASLSETEEKLIADQARVRENLTVVGTDSRSGAAYLTRLEELEDRLIQISESQSQQREQVEAASAELADLIASSHFGD